MQLARELLKTNLSSLHSTPKPYGHTCDTITIRIQYDDLSSLRRKQLIVWNRTKVVTNSQTFRPIAVASYLWQLHGLYQYSSIYSLQLHQTSISETIQEALAATVGSFSGEKEMWDTLGLVAAGLLQRGRARTPNDIRTNWQTDGQHHHIKSPHLRAGYNNDNRDTDVRGQFS